eukprot:COSAG02_NODE_46947_length_345_cov_0.532520_1_plen_38_part_10
MERDALGAGLSQPDVEGGGSSTGNDRVGLAGDATTDQH